MVTLGDKIKLLRALFGLKQLELAQRISISQGQLSNIEAGLVTPDEKTLDSIRAIFGGVDLDDPRIVEFASLKCQSIAA